MAIMFIIISSSSIVVVYIQCCYYNLFYTRHSFQSGTKVRQTESNHKINMYLLCAYMRVVTFFSGNINTI